MKHAFLLLISILVVCTTYAQRKYEQMGIKFKVPKDWIITEETPEKNAYSFCCEKEGDTESGSVMFAYIGRDLDMNAFLALCMQNAENSANLSEGKNFTWGTDTTDVKVGDFIARQVTYKVDILGLAFSNKILVFKACGNMVMLNTTEADEDHAKNEKGFDTIMNSISCK
jgi:hypothetical protein